MIENNWIKSLRYYLYTGSPESINSFCDLVCDNWNEIDPEDKFLMKQELRRAFHRDDCEKQMTMNPCVERFAYTLGNTITQHHWGRIKNLYGESF